MILLAAAAAAVIYTEDGKCKLEKVSTPKRPSLVQRITKPVAKAPVKKAKKKAKPEEEYVPCPPLKPPSLFSLIPPPDEPVGPIFAPEVPNETASPCHCFAESVPTPDVGGIGSRSADAYMVGRFVDGGGGAVHQPGPPVHITPVPEPEIWASLGLGLLFLFRLRRI